MNKNTFIPALPHTKISIPERKSKKSTGTKVQKSTKISEPHFWNIKSMINEDNLTEECQNRLNRNSENMRKMIICILIIVFVLFANLALLYSDFADDNDSISNIPWSVYNTKPAAEFMRPNIVPKENQQILSQVYEFQKNPSFNLRNP